MIDGEKKQKNNGNKKPRLIGRGKRPAGRWCLCQKLPIKWRTIANRRPRASLSNIPAKWFTGLTENGGALKGTEQNRSEQRAAAKQRPTERDRTMLEPGRRQMPQDGRCAR